MLLEWDALEKGKLRNDLKKKIMDGAITKRLQLKRAIKEGGGVIKAGRKKTTKTAPNVSAQLLMKAMKEKSKDMKLDRKSQQMLKKLMEEAQDIVDI